MPGFLFSESMHSSSHAKSHKIYGVMPAIVTNNVDPERQYRVRVRFPWLHPGDQSAWARVTTFMASSGGAGAFFLPEIDDEVLVAFIDGEIDHPVVVGVLWNGVDKPPYSNHEGRSDTGRFQDNHKTIKGSTQARKNDLRSISSRTGHELVLNDNAVDPRVVVSSGQKHRIVLDDSNNEATQIEICDGKEENYILIDTKNKKITIETRSGDLVLKAKHTLRLEAEAVEIQSTHSTSVTAGKNYHVQATGGMTHKAGGQINVESSGPMVIKGTTVNLN